MGHLQWGALPVSENQGPRDLCRGSRSATRWPRLLNACSSCMRRNVSATSAWGPASLLLHLHACKYWFMPCSTGLFSMPLDFAPCAHLGQP